jgi:hypothetical protein
MLAVLIGVLLLERVVQLELLGNLSQVTAFFIYAMLGLLHFLLLDFDIFNNL